KKNTTTTAPLITPTPAESQATQKIIWDKDSVNGITSIQILLNWLAIDRNFASWCGNKTGSTKQAMANEIVALLVEAGITHQNQKGVLTKIGELQLLYQKASDFHCHTGSGLQESGIANATHTLQMALIKKCKYRDKLHPVMATRTSATLHTNKLPDMSVPNLLGSTLLDKLVPDILDDNDDLNIDQPSSALASELPLQTPERWKSNVARQTTTGASVLQPERNTMMEKARVDKEGAWIDNKINRDNQMLKVEKMKTMMVLERESQIKIKQNKLAETRRSLTFIKELKARGDSKKEIKMYMGLLFQNPGKGSAQAAQDPTNSDSDKNSDSDEKSDSDESTDNNDN
ncbi:hypothetical protein PSTT_02941, partial [Puccinia striiformis]